MDQTIPASTTVSTLQQHIIIPLSVLWRKKTQYTIYLYHGSHNDMKEQVNAGVLVTFNKVLFRLVLQQQVNSRTLTVPEWYSTPVTTDISCQNGC